MSLKTNTFNAEAQSTQRDAEKTKKLFSSDSFPLRSLRLCVKCPRIENP